MSSIKILKTLPGTLERVQADFPDVSTIKSFLPSYGLAPDLQESLETVLDTEAIIAGEKIRVFKGTGSAALSTSSALEMLIDIAQVAGNYLEPHYGDLIGPAIGKCARIAYPFYRSSVPELADELFSSPVLRLSDPRVYGFLTTANDGLVPPLGAVHTNYHNRNFTVGVSGAEATEDLISLMFPREFLDFENGQASDEAKDPNQRGASLIDEVCAEMIARQCGFAGPDIRLRPEHRLQPGMVAALEQQIGYGATT